MSSVDTYNVSEISFLGLGELDQKRLSVVLVDYCDSTVSKVSPSPQLHLSVVQLLRLALLTVLLRKNLSTTFYTLIFLLSVFLFLKLVSIVPLLFIPPVTVTQPGALQSNLFSTAHVILSQNAEASRSQLVTPTTNAHLVAREAVELLAGQSADQIQLWTNVTTQAQLEDYTIISHLAAVLIYISAAQIQETGLSASAKNIDKILYDLQSQLIVAWRLMVQELTKVLDFLSRKTFVDAFNLLAWLLHLGGWFTFAPYMLARGTAKLAEQLRRNILESSKTQREQTDMVTNQESFVSVIRTNLFSIGRNLQTQYNLINTCQTSARHALTPAMILTRMLSKVPNVLLVIPNHRRVYQIDTAEFYNFNGNLRIPLNLHILIVN
ncbi:MAG: hypothetical protein EZS28_033080 [Streblomastix strix]|uniref:Uncharacterized protein n=1 Tax=Streblomastix strix TaxID=222440 RepID=A0A5J4UMT2_9EUKA|nr:MAG: hypothetical protein EZS28_033080 [Streblomastix strix]